MSRRLFEAARRLLRDEQGTIYKPLEGRVKFALASPNVYRVGMSSLGFQIVYGLLNEMPDVVCERVFLPEETEIAEFRRSETPLFTLESQTPVSRFDILGFSISFELESLNVLGMLDLSHLPLLARDRNESHPLVIAGGPYVTFNPEPLSDFIDAFVIGEAEEVLVEIMQALTGRMRKADKNAPSRAELLEELARIGGVYVPSLYDVRYRADGTIEEIIPRPPAPPRVQQRKVMDLDRQRVISVILTPNAEFSDMLLAEAIRGCGRQCRFCIAGFSSLPPRPRSIDAVARAASFQEMLANRDVRSRQRVALIGSAVFDHPEALAICEKLTSNGLEFSVSSIRIETLTPELARMMRQGGQRTITLAPEAGTERLRRVINKATSDAEIMEAIRMASDAGFEKVKLYFMIGLPTETDEDVYAITELVREIIGRFSRLILHLSVSCFVPKPWTPFQWCGMADESALAEKLRLLRKSLSREKHVRILAESPREARYQAFLARGDRRVGKALLTAFKERVNLLRAARKENLDPEFYISRQRGENEIFPWEHIDLWVSRSYLWKEYCRALSEQVTPPCIVGRCARCGVC